MGVIQGLPWMPELIIPDRVFPHPEIGSRQLPRNILSGSGKQFPKFVIRKKVPKINMSPYKGKKILHKKKCSVRTRLKEQLFFSQLCTIARS